jgi:hypothetical protein
LLVGRRKRRPSDWSKANIGFHLQFLGEWPAGGIGRKLAWNALNLADDVLKDGLVSRSSDRARPGFQEVPAAAPVANEVGDDQARRRKGRGDFGGQIL